MYPLPLKWCPSRVPKACSSNGNRILHLILEIERLQMYNAQNYLNPIYLLYPVLDPKRDGGYSLRTRLIVTLPVDSKFPLCGDSNIVSWRMCTLWDFDRLHNFTQPFHVFAIRGTELEKNDSPAP